ncbi:MAG: iron-containing alcohol dehydrogenase [Chlorobi bacterium]|nr:iron-containing alcohol dehydrogenase [Chlorobiota bacterium]
MENFVLSNPTVLHFGKNVIEDLADQIKQLGKKVLLIYGKGSVKKYGYYEKVTNKLREANIDFVEFAGIKPNPDNEVADDAVRFGVEQNVDVVLALGGGSVIDSAKVIAVSIPENLKTWDVMKGKKVPTKALPIITILTVAATGTEMNHFSVLQNNTTKEKIGTRNVMMYPKYSYLDPEFTYSIPKDYTAYGMVDIIAHSFENFFGYGTSPLADRFAVSIIKEVMNFAPLLLEDLRNYEYRANMMLQATYALNGTLAAGKTSGDWGVHSIGHILSLQYDTPHGASLSIAYPAWFKLMKNKIPERIKDLSLLLFNTEDIDLFISKIEDFFKSINSPIRLQDTGINTDKKQEIINLLTKNEASGFNYQFNEYEKLVDLMYL